MQLIDRHKEDELEEYLDSGERIIWYGIPKQGLMLQPQDVFLVPFSLLWGGFAFTWEFIVVTSSINLFFAIWGIPFVLVGIYLIIGRFFVDAYKRKKTIYGITDKRILIQSGVYNKSFRSAEIKMLSDVLLRERKDGSGSIMFGLGSEILDRSGSFFKPGTKAVLSFDRIPEVRDVYNKLMDLRGK